MKKKGLIKNMVPISVKSPSDIWYMDVNGLSLSELIKLKSELIGYSTQSIRVLDAIIHNMAGTTYDETFFDRRDIRREKGGYRNEKAFIRLRKKKI